MVASDEHGYTTEKAVVECKGEVFEKVLRQVGAEVP